MLTLSQHQHKIHFDLLNLFHLFTETNQHKMTLLDQNTVLIIFSIQKKIHLLFKKFHKHNLNLNNLCTLPNYL